MVRMINAATTIQLVFRLLFSLDAASCFVPTFTSKRRHLSPSSLHAKLEFDAKIALESAVMTETELSEYFPTEHFRRHCLSAGGTSVTKDISWDDQLKQSFYELYGGDDETNQPSLPESVHTVETAIQFPGIQLHNTVTIACHLENDGNDNSYYENYLIAEEKYVTGAPPMVFLYNKLANPKVGRTEPSGTAYTKISKLKTSDESTIVTTNSTVSIRVDFPNILIRILPTSQEKMEQQGSMSVQTAVAKDIHKFMSTLPDAMAEWMEEKRAMDAA